MISREDMEQIVEAGVQRALRDIGIMDSDPFEMRKDFAHLREWRLTMEQVRNKGMGAATMMVISGFIALLLIGFKGWIFH